MNSTNRIPVLYALRVAVLLGVLSGLPGVALSGTVSVFDNMDNAAALGQYQTFEASSGQGTSTVPAAGGNPGAFTNLALILDVDEGFQITRVWNFASYNPSVSGPVTSAIASYDIRRTFSSDLGATQVAKWVAALQDGILHLEFYGVSTNPDWEPFTSGNLVTDIPEINWASGSEILFGFGNSAFAGLGVPFRIDGGYDNFSVRVEFRELDHQVPEPASLTLLGLGMIGLAAGRSLWRGSRSRGK